MIIKNFILNQCLSYHFLLHATAVNNDVINLAIDNRLGSLSG